MMDTEAVKAVTAFLTDAVKILGPAIIAAYATYRATLGQVAHRMRALEAKTELAARSRIFDLLRERSQELIATANKVQSELGRVMGFLSDDVDEETLGIAVKAATTLSKVVPIEIAQAKTYLQQSGLMESAEARALMVWDEEMKWGTIERTRDALLGRLLQLQEVFMYLQACQRSAITTQMNLVFAPFLMKSATAQPSASGTTKS